MNGAVKLIIGISLVGSVASGINHLGEAFDLWDTPEEKFTKEILAGAEPVIGFVDTKTLAENGDTITSQSTDTIAWKIAADKFQPK